MVERDSGVSVCVCSALGRWWWGGGSKINQVCEEGCHRMGYLSQFFWPAALSQLLGKLFIKEKEEEAHPRACLCGFSHSL